MGTVTGRATASLDIIGQGWRFATGLRRFLRDPVDAASAVAEYRHDVEHREERFLASLDHNVWPDTESPYLPLLERAGIDRAALRDMVGRQGLDASLELLRDEGVYISYEEYLGRVPVRRGSLRVDVAPTSFHNRTITADYLGSTGGTRSGGTPVAVSFADKRHTAARSLVTRVALGEPEDSPSATWFPCLPSAAGLGMVLAGVGGGHAPERWFSQIPTSMDGVPLAKRITNKMLPFVGRLSGVPLPGPEHVPSSRPDPVLDWCVDALARRGVAHLSTYPSSAVRLARLASDQGVRLDGLTVVLTGEPATLGRRAVIEGVGARTVAMYAFMQAGGVGYTCPEEMAERYHLNDGKFAVVSRRRQRDDEVPVDAFAWTTLSPTARGVFINVENDDYGTVSRDQEPCRCLHGQLGCRTRVADVRGMSKIVAGGVTVAGEVVERLVDDVLPRTIGGTPLDYQFVERDDDGQGVLVLRIDPGLPDVDEGVAVAAVRAELHHQEMGRLADEIWAPTGAVRVERTTPVAAKSGKTLPFEPLPAEKPAPADTPSEP